MLAGRPFGLRPFGARALNSLRLEQAYGGWGREYAQDYTPAEAGLDRFVREEKPTFVGREAALEERSAVPARRLRLLAIDSRDPDPVGGEPVLSAGQAIGRLTSAAFGYTVGRALGFAYLPSSLRETEALEVEILGCRVRARILSVAPYDAAGTRLRG